jgi:glutamate synthase (NADPH/NADH) small chain
MPEQDAQARRRNVSEVAQGYTEERARIEAMRCLQCKNAPCVEGCPVRIRIRDFVGAIAEGDYGKALQIIKENSLLPAVCGRVCPQEVQCQEKCTVGLSLDVSKAVSIGRLETRFVADLNHDDDSAVPKWRPPTGMKVAIIGSVPADCRRRRCREEPA